MFRRQIQPAAQDGVIEGAVVTAPDDPGLILHSAQVLGYTALDFLAAHPDALASYNQWIRDTGRALPSTPDLTAGSLHGLARVLDHVTDTDGYAPVREAADAGH